MEKKGKVYFLLLMAAALIAVMAMPALASSGGSAPDRDRKPLPNGQISRIAFGSCAKQWQHQLIWDAVIAEKPDLWLFLGDAVYADTDGQTAWPVTEKTLQGEWNRLADKPEFQKARAAVPMMATWDNHDYGTHDGGVEFELKEASKRIFLDFFGEPADSWRRNTPGIYDAKIFGPDGRRVQIILLDTRFFKDIYKKDPTPKSERFKAGKVGGYLPDGDPEKTLLGDRQWRWLELQMKKPAEVRLIASSIQVIPDKKGMDEWGNFPLERTKLFDLIAGSGAKGIILLSGNVHFAELSKSYAEDYPLFELTASGMTHVNKVYAKVANEYRIAGPFTGPNFGLVEIDWETKPSPLVTLKAISEDGNTVFSHPVRLDELRSSKISGEKKLIACPDPRPEICTQEYRPVCTNLQDGGLKTYSNGCSACTDPSVTGYREGACE
ncbi:MAG: alkaline phosphatase D family protein [Deltaproteobacteria bacterium]|nr:MAG: alkaline phosphatase D family protein [Deltaproteobacteria bacterium]